MQPSHGTESHYQETVVFSYTSVPLYAFMTWTGTTLPLPFVDSLSNSILDNYFKGYPILEPNHLSHICSYHQRDKQENM